MPSSSSLLVIELPASETSAVTPSSRRGASWSVTMEEPPHPPSRPGATRSLAALAEVATRANAISTDGAGGAAALTTLDDAMAAAIEAGKAAGDAGASMFAEGADLLTDLVVICTWTLQRKRAALEGAIASGDAARVGDACDSARRAVVRALAAIERALVLPGTPGAIARLVEQETERSLRVRALYRAFRAAVRPETAPNASVEARLTAAGVALAKVFASPAHGALRASDRRLFREIEARLGAYWSAPGAPAAGLRLFQDIAAFAGCLRAINHRAELLDHDARIAAEALGACAGDPEGAVGDATLEALGALLGRDDELDALLLGRRPARRGTLGPMLERFARRG